MNTPLTPHGPGFRFVDHFEKTTRDCGTGSKYLDPAMPVFADHFPGRPLLPAVLMIECAAQAAGILWMDGCGDPTAPLFLAGVEKFRALRPVSAGERLEARLRVVKDFGNLAVFDFELMVKESAVARGQLTLSREVREA